MDIGLDAYHPEHADMFADLGVKWTKLPVSLHDPADAPDPLVVDAVERGMKVVVDLRTNQGQYRPIVDEYRQRGITDAWRYMARDLAQMAATAVKRYSGLVKHWEFWGEYACPFVSSVPVDRRGDGYGYLLREVAASIRATDASAEVWTGGHGPNFDLRYIMDLCETEAATIPDAINLHHYNYLYPWPPMDGTAAQHGGGYLPDRSVSLERRVQWIAGRYDQFFAEARARLARVGIRAPRLVSTEWGMPVVMDGAAEGSGMESFVFDARIEGVEETPAATIMQACLDSFARNGLEVVLYHAPTDGPPREDGRLHWGAFCGLTYVDGQHKATYDVLKRQIAKGHPRARKGGGRSADSRHA
ncbi:MAG: hypothetical protein M0R37_12265 [Bacteroidales bacterium]|jgi:hypothetical protein|nr:hypothetical protein [Bacteroidales bacterium]